MKTFILLLLLVLIAPLAYATDWSKYDSGDRSLRVTGYHTQPGYIGFYDEGNVIRGYLYAHADGNLYWSKVTATSGHTATDLTTSKLGTQGGEQKVNN